jgi:uncharacterized protein YjbI with pentapeptide repeats
MARQTRAQTKKPVPFLLKPVKLDLKSLASALAQLTVNAATGNWGESPSNVAGAAEAIGLKPEPAEIGWRLVFTALLQAVQDIIDETHDPKIQEVNYESLIENLKTQLQDFPVQLDENFFAEPQNIKLFERFSPVFRTWLQNLGFSDVEAQMLSERLPRYFVMALHNEWGSRPIVYGELLKPMDTPFSKNYEEIRQWSRYGSWLQKQIEKPVFSEVFSLRQVFVPLRAYFLEKKSETTKPERLAETEFKGSRKYVVKLQEHLLEWITNNNKDDAIRLISGGPGSGKSSVSKVLAAHIAEQAGDLRVVFIPLHLLSLSSDLTEAINTFAEQSEVMPDFILPSTQRLLLIFDGLDELAMQGKSAARAAADFLSQLDRLVQLYNSTRSSVIQAIVAGREVVIQDSENLFRKPGQVLHVLPYFVPEEEQQNSTRIDTDFHDPKELLAVDQREIWWEQYGKSTGQRELRRMPNELKTSHLDEITAQPLLNYLVALSRKRGKLVFTKDTNLNEVYNDLLVSVYERGWDANVGYQNTKHITEIDFIRVLEEISICTWHGNGRTTTVQAIEQRCASSGLKRIIDDYIANLENDPKAGITNLMTAFYFRQSTEQSADKTFEFTHKSFGEYLIARRFVATMFRIHEEWTIRKTHYDKGWNELTCLIKSFDLCGTTAIDEYLLRFLRAEMELKWKSNPDEVLGIQNTFCHLIEFMLQTGLPVELLTTRLSFQQEVVQARNTEEALFVAVHLCNRLTKQLAKVNFPSRKSMGDVIRRVAGQRDSAKNPILFECLGNWDFSGSHFDLADLYKINFTGTFLKSTSFLATNLLGAILIKANLEGAELRSANLEGANFGGAHLLKANFNNANLAGTFFQSANLEGANFNKAILEEAYFYKANLTEANLTEANLTGANLTEANLTEANLTGANLTGANLKGVIMDKKTRATANLTKKQKASIQLID